MTWAGFVWRNLRRRKTRTVLTAAGVSVGVGLIVALLSIAAGVRQTANDLIHVGRADFGLFQNGAADLTRSLLPEALAAKVRAAPGVAQAARIFLRVSTTKGNSAFLVFGLVPGEFPERRLVIVEGHRPNGREALLGDNAARTLHLKPGGLLQVEHARFRVAGIYHSGDRYEDGGAVLPLPVVQRLSAHPREVTTLAVTVQLGRRPKDVAHDLERRFPGLAAVVEPGQAVKVDTSSRVIIDSGWIFSLLALIVGGIGVTNTMAMSVFERTREIGIMRAVGWPSRRIALLILSEAVGIGTIALGLGLLVGWIAAKLFTSQSALSSLVAPDFTASVFLWGLAFALGVGVLGALYPAWRAVRLQPIEALRRD